MTEEHNNQLENDIDANDKKMRKPIVRQNDLISDELPALTETQEESSKEADLAPSFTAKLKAIWNSRLFSNILVALSVIFFALGAYFFIKPMVIHKNQDRIAQDLLDRLKEQEPGSTDEISVDVDIKDIHLPGSDGDEYDYFLPDRPTKPSLTLPEATETAPKAPSVVTITTDSIMRIPKINLEIAVAPDVNAASLWVLPGHYPSSPQPGENGVTSYFGHRMYGKGRHFNRLNEVGPGDTIHIQRKGYLYTYVIESSDIIEPSELGKYVYETSYEPRILLVTCHPIQTTGVPKYRIVVRGVLESAEPLN